jgi:uncharacterized Zn finger protein (UPF0148 family)
MYLADCPSCHLLFGIRPTPRIVCPYCGHSWSVREWSHLRKEPTERPDDSS